jgi:hypothetical protein
MYSSIGERTYLRAPAAPLLWATAEFVEPGSHDRSPLKARGILNYYERKAA